MSYVTIVQDLPPEFQLTMLKLVEAVEQNMREQLAVRREDFDELKATVQELVEAQKRTEQRIDRLEIALLELAEAQKRTEQRIEELVEAQKRMEEVITRLEVAIISLTEAQFKFRDRQDQLIGKFLEYEYRDKAHAYFGRLLRRTRVVAWPELEDDLENRLPDYERNDLLLLDLLVRGRPRLRPEVTEVWLAVEVSQVVDSYDVERAQRRAAILKRIGYPIIPTVAGEQITSGGEEAARAGQVLLLQDGTIQFWQEALAQSLAG